MKRATVTAIAWLLAGMVQAQDNTAQRQRIAAERAEAHAAYETRAADCVQRFVVTSCMNEARRQRRDTLDRLQRQQVLLDEAERKQRAAQRIDAIRSKVAAESSATRAPPALPSARLKLREPAPVASAPARAAHQPAAHAAAAERSRQQRADKQRERQAEAQAHRAAVEQRNAQRAASGKKPAAPLPLPKP